MSGKRLRIADIAELRSGGTPARSVPSYFKGEIPWVKTLDLTGGWIQATEERISEDARISFRGEVFPPGTVLVAMYGGAGTIGKSGILSFRATINQALCALLPRPAVWDSEFVNYWLRHIRPEWMKFSAGNRKDPNINKEVVSNKTLLVPPLAEQHRVRDKLRHALTETDLCAARAAEQVSAAELFLLAELREEFRHIVPLTCDPSEAPTPADCSWMRLTEVARLESGHTPSRRRPEWWGGSVPWLALPDIRKLHGKFAYETLETTNDAGLANSSARLLPVGTVCVSRTASIGFVTILGRPMATSQDFCNWICDPETLDPEFLMYAFMASQDHLRELGSGAVHKTIYMPTIQSFHICAPPIEEQRRIGRRLRERLAAAEELTTGLRARLAEIELLPQRILAATFGAPA